MGDGGCDGGREGGGWVFSVEIADGEEGDNDIVHPNESGYLRLCCWCCAFCEEAELSQVGKNFYTVIGRSHGSIAIGAVQMCQSLAVLSNLRAVKRCSRPSQEY